MTFAQNLGAKKEEIRQDRFAILARDASGRIMSWVTVQADPAKQPLQAMMAVARTLVRIKGCVRTEIHPLENDASMSARSPLVVLMAQNLLWGHVSPATPLGTREKSSQTRASAYSLCRDERTQLMTMTIPYTEQLSEQWLLERTYHAYLRDGKELSVSHLTQAMQTLTGVSVPLSTWQEISQEEAHTAYQQGTPILLYSEHAWEHQKGATSTWRVSKNMRTLIYGNAWKQAEAVSGTTCAVCSLDLQQGNSSNATWRTWFSTDPAMLFAGSAPITFLRPRVQFPSTTHYTVIAADGHISEHAGHSEALQGYQTFPPQEVSQGSDSQTVFPQFCYYHEVTCPDGVYHLEFFGPRMNRYARN